MKKLIAAGIFVLTSMSFAQNAEFGIKIGGVFNADKGVIKTTDGVYNDKGKGSVGFQAGGIVRLKAGGLYVQPELLFTSFKNEYDDSFGNSFEIGKKRIDIPVNVGKSFAAGLVHFQLGPVFSYYFEDDLSLDEFSVAEKDEFNMGFQFGTGLRIKNFLFDLRYELGLGKNTTKFINDNIESSNGFQTENRSKLLNLSVGYFF